MKYIVAQYLGELRKDDYHHGDCLVNIEKSRISIGDIVCPPFDMDGFTMIECHRKFYSLDRAE